MVGCQSWFDGHEFLGDRGFVVVLQTIILQPRQKLLNARCAEKFWKRRISTQPAPVLLRDKILNLITYRIILVPNLYLKIAKILKKTMSIFNHPLEFNHTPSSLSELKIWSSQNPDFSFFKTGSFDFCRAPFGHRSYIFSKGAGSCLHHAARSLAPMMWRRLRL
jgi:hypothetical protein